MRHEPARLLPASYPCMRPLSLIYADLDTAGHVNNVSYARFFEEGRAFFWSGVRAKLGDAMPTGGRLARVEIDYLAEMTYPADFRVGIGILDIGRTSFRLSEAVFLGDVCTALCTAVDVTVDPATGRPVALSEEHRAILSELRVQ